MNCTRKVGCTTCGGLVRDKTVDELKRDPDMPFVCTDCTTEYAEDQQCGGKIEKVWKNGKLFDCVCATCGIGYGKNALERERILEQFSLL